MATAKKAPSKKTPAKKASPALKTAIKIPHPRKMDAKLIAATQKWEVSYEATKTGHSAAEVKAAVEALGHSRVKVRKALGAAAAPMAAKKAVQPGGLNASPVSRNVSGPRVAARILDAATAVRCCSTL